MPAVKRCPNCDRPVFSMAHGSITVHAPARVETIEATGDVVALCACKRRVTWFKARKQARATVTVG